MKMLPAHLATLRAAIAPLDTPQRREAYLKGRFRGAEKCLDRNKRYRWDLLWASGLPISDAQGVAPLYTYLDDTHVDTALRSIVPDLLPTRASLKSQAASGSYVEPDDVAHFTALHWVKDGAIRLRILTERAVIRTAVRSILAEPDLTISVSDGESFVVKKSRDLNAIMGEVGSCDEEFLYVRRNDTSVGILCLVHGNGNGAEVIADHTDTAEMAGHLQQATKLAEELAA